MSIYEEPGFADFGDEDRGGFKHPATVGEFSYDELEAKVLAAIDDDNGAGDGRGFRTLMRIKTHAGIEKAFDLSPVIEGMELDKKIRREDNGNITAFFRSSQKPTRFWINGDGTIGAEFDENFEPAVEARDAPEYNGRPVGHVDIDPDELEQAAAKFKNTTEIAKHLGLVAGTLYNKLNGSATLKAAYDRGRHVFAAKQAANRPQKHDPIPAVVPKPKQTKEKVMNTTAVRPALEQRPETGAAELPVDPDRVRAASVSERTLVDVAAACGLGQAAFSRHLKNHPALRTAYDEGRTVYYQKNPKRTRSKDSSSDRIKSYTLEDVERLAAELGDKQRVARALGYKEKSGFYQVLRKSPDIKAAYHRGLAKFDESEENDLNTGNHDSRPGHKDPHISQIAKSADRPLDTGAMKNGRPIGGEGDLASNIDLTKVEELARTGVPRPKAAKMLGMNRDTFTWHVKGRAKDKRIFDAWQRGLQERDQTASLQPVIEGEPENHPEPSSSVQTSAEEFASDEGLQVAMLPVNPDPLTPVKPDLPKPAVHHRFVTFQRGGQALVGFEGNFFDLKPEERELLIKLTDTFDAFENRNRSFPAQFKLQIDTTQLEAALDRARTQRAKPPSRWERFAAMFRKKAAKDGK